MTKITTDDCKSFIRNALNLSTTIPIKREKKYKDINGDVIRVFLVNNLDTCLIKENKQGTLEIVNEASIVQKEKTFNAKAFLRKYIKKLSDDDNDVIEIGEEYLAEGKSLTAEEKRTLANEFYYCFPLVYENDTESVVNGLDTPMFRNNQYESYGLFFHDSLSSDPELYIDEIVRVLIPKYFEKVDENIFEIKYSKETKDMTINDVIKVLDSVGMSYKNCPEFFGEHDCMLKHLNLK